MAEGVFGIGLRNGEQSLLQQAAGGTLYFNDILMMPRSQQDNLLRFMQERKLDTPGGSQEFDVRILAGYSGDLEKALAEKE